MTGMRRYSERLISGLQKIGVPVRTHRVRKLEFNIGGKPAGGLLSQRLFASFISTSAPVVHSLSPDVITGKTNVATIHDLIPFYHTDTYMKTRRERAGYSIMFGKIDELYLIVQTEHTRAQLKSLGIDETMVEVCGIGVQELFKPSTRPSPYPEDGKKHLVAVGDFNPRKRFDILYNAVSAMKGVELYHVGPVNNWVQRYTELKRIADARGSVHMLGPLPDDRLVDYLTYADLLVHATEDEGAGYTPAEAMACGTRALVNPIPVFRELYGNDVRYCDLTIEGFAEGIKRALEMRTDRVRMMASASKFSAEEEARRVAAVYRRVAEAAGH